jgi:hypothetical protein
VGRSIRLTVLWLRLVPLNQDMGIVMSEELLNQLCPPLTDVLIEQRLFLANAELVAKQAVIDGLVEQHAVLRREVTAAQDSRLAMSGRLNRLLVFLFDSCRVACEERAVWDFGDEPSDMPFVRTLVETHGMAELVREIVLTHRVSVDVTIRVPCGVDETAAEDAVREQITDYLDGMKFNVEGMRIDDEVGEVYDVSVALD